MNKNKKQNKNKEKYIQHTCMECIHNHAKTIKYKRADDLFLYKYCANALHI